MNDSAHDTKKTAVIKTLAIIGFVAAMLLAVWLAVQIVRVLPAAFSSLASLIEGTDAPSVETFTVATDRDLVNTGETVTFSWTAFAERGTYTFSYECADGTAAEFVQSPRNTPVACDRAVALPDNANSVRIALYSERERFADIRYTITFTPRENGGAVAESGVVTVVNTSVPAHGADTETEREDEETEDETGDRSGGTPQQPTGYITVPTTVTEIPRSDPNGYADLEVRFLGVGSHRHDRFTPRDELEEGERGAIQFEVKNIGTKTSGTWYFSAELPTDPSFTYVSNAQTGLKPNERQIITLQFDNTAERGSENLRIRVTGGNDVRTGNNTVTARVRIDD